ncbi:MAG: fumarylacetoacetase, partial [Actinomycetota bacterium]|nr:fumarylacetoacetase [Actinomycetota bacterium]
MTDANATANASYDGFGVENLPLGVARLPDGRTVCVSALGEHVIVLSTLAHAGVFRDARLPGSVLVQPSLLPFLACGRPARRFVRGRLAELITDRDRRLTTALVPRDEVEMQLPVAVGDFVDFNASIHHATNMGRLLRPGSDPLPPHWRRFPPAYHGRAGSVVATGAPVVRPHGWVTGADSEPVMRSTSALDFEAEVGFVVDGASHIGSPVPPSAFVDHVAGLVLVNDWSARDVQAAESRPLGPFLGKSFATSVSPWLVTLEALEPYRVDGPVQDPPVARYLTRPERSAYDIRLEVSIQSIGMRAAGLPPCTVTRPELSGQYWTFPQLLAHATVNGAAVRPGDLFASGAVSGPDPGTEGSLMELSWAGERPLRLPDGSIRTYLKDGDTVTLRGWAGGDDLPLLALGEVTATVEPAHSLD